MYLKIEYWETIDNEVTGYDCWKDSEKCVPVKLGVIEGAAAYEITEIGTDYIKLCKANGQQVSLGTYSGAPKPLDTNHRTEEETLRVGESTSVSSGYTYNGNSHGGSIDIKLMEGELPQQ
jgi:hypothetical protein